MVTRELSFSLHLRWRILLSAFVLVLVTVTVPGQALSVSVSNSPAMLGVLRAAEEVPFDVNVEFHRTQNDAVVRLVRGDVDAAILPIYVAARVHSEGTELRLTHAVYGTFVTIVERAGATEDVRSLQDLRDVPLLIGKQAGPLRVFPMMLLQEHGLEATIPTTGATADQIAQMLISGQADHGVLREPLSTSVIRRVPGSRRVIDLQEEWENAFGSPMVQAGVVFRAASVADHPEECAVLSREISSGYRWLQDNPRDAAALAARLVPGANQGIIEAALPVMAIYAEEIPNNPENNRHVEDFLLLLTDRQPEMIGGSLPDQSFYGGF